MQAPGEITADLFRLFARQVRHSKTVNATVRDALFCNLHYVHGVAEEAVADFLGMKKRAVKHALKLGVGTKRADGGFQKVSTSKI